MVLVSYLAWRKNKTRPIVSLCLGVFWCSLISVRAFPCHNCFQTAPSWSQLFETVLLFRCAPGLSGTPLKIQTTSNLFNVEKYFFWKKNCSSPVVMVDTITSNLCPRSKRSRKASPSLHYHVIYPCERTDLSRHDLLPFSVHGMNDHGVNEALRGSRLL